VLDKSLTTQYLFGKGNGLKILDWTKHAMFPCL